MSGGLAGLLAFLAGAVQVLSFAPWEFWWLQPLSVGVLVALVAHAPPGASALRGWLFACGWFAAGLWWLYISLHVYGYLPAWLSVAAVALLAALLALYYAIAAGLWARSRRGRPGADALSFAAWWLLAELARGTFFTGFPWIASGYAHTRGPLAAWAPWIGVYGIDFLSAWSAAAAALWLTARRGAARWHSLVAPAIAVAAGAALPHDFTRSTGTLAVTLLQTDVAQNDKFEEAQVRDALTWHLDRFRAARGQLVLTPESSLPILPSQIPPELWAAYQQAFDAPGRAALVGTFTGDDDRGYTNSVVGLDAHHHMTDGSNYHYGKRHLLPFGEFIPPGFGWMLAMMKVPIGDQARGTDTAPFAVAGQRVRPLVCYEDLFGEDFAESMVGPGSATLLANVTNLAWFGPRMIQDQHLQFSRMRALEFQRGQVRATNTGATAVIDYRGEVTARLPPETVGQLDARVEGRTGDTPYATWLARWKLWPLWGLGVALAVLVRFVRRH